MLIIVKLHFKLEIFVVPVLDIIVQSNNLIETARQREDYAATMLRGKNNV